jgi:hypothetical protein
MQYLLMAYVDESAFPKLTPEQQNQGMAAYTAFTTALENAGALKGVNRLGPSSSATTVRVANGKSQVLDGPYPDSKEQLGGYFLIETDNLDGALAWAARCPAAEHGVVEVRPVALM